MDNKELYLKGFSVAEIIRKKHLSDTESIAFIKELTNKDIDQHREVMKRRITDLYQKGDSVNLINKKTCVSVSVIKKILSI